jgi:hypothetical protein
MNTSGPGAQDTPRRPTKIRPDSWFSILAGFVCGLGAGSLDRLFDFLNNPFLIGAEAARWFSQNEEVVLFFNLLGLPLIALMLVIIPWSRRFGLGFMLAAGLCWLIWANQCAKML